MAGRVTHFDARILSGVSVMLVVAEAGSFARAAAILGLSPSGVSRAVLRLEERVGVRLFDRGPRAVMLTEEGRRFYIEVGPLLNSIEDAATELSGTSSAVRGRLRAGLDPWFSRMILAPHLPRFMAENPELQVDIVVANRREDMMTGIDVAIRFGPPENSSLIGRKLLDTRVITCAAPAYLTARGRPQMPEDLAFHEALLFRDPQGTKPFAWEFLRDGTAFEVDVQGRLQTDDPFTAIAACAAGLGIMQSLELGLEPWLASGQLVQVLTEYSGETWPLYAYHPSKSLPPAKVRRFLDFAETITSTEAAKSRHRDTDQIALLLKEIGLQTGQIA